MGHSISSFIQHIMVYLHSDSISYSLPAIGVSGLLLALLISYIMQLVASPVRDIPGPFLARFTDLWYFWQMKSGRFQYVNQDLHKKYGTIVRYGPDRYSFDELEAAKTVYGINKFPKSNWYAAWETPGQWSTFGDRNIKRHARTRRLFQPEYTMSSLVHYEPYVDECSDIFAQRVEEMTQSKSVVDLEYWFQCYAFDVIGYITYAKRIGFLDRGDDIEGVVHALDGFQHYSTLTGIFPALHPYLARIKNLLAGGKGTGRAYVLSFTVEQIRKAKAKPKAAAAADSVEDFLSKWIAKNKADPDVFTDFHILSGCAHNMFAGSDTTAITLSAVFYYLIQNPACLNKLRAEIDNLTKRGDLSKSPKFKESQQMPYLQAVIKEALRMHPAVGVLMERVVSEGGATICGRYFPQGTKVGINAWVAHRNTHVFGEDANDFNPERWLITDKDKLTVMNNYFFSFGMGTRSCLGRHIAMLEISKLVPRLVRDYDFKLEDSLQGREWHVKNFFFTKPMDFKVRVEKRRLETSSL